MRLNFSTKAGTLSDLKKILGSARIAPMVIIAVSEWPRNKEIILKKIADELSVGPYIVRSSSGAEDTEKTSNAGAFLSVPDINFEELGPAIKNVISSYTRPNPQDEVLIQPMLRNVIRSGVAFSHDPNTCSPYRVINWTEGSDTSAVTQGQAGRVWQIAAGAPIPEDTLFSPILELVGELLDVFEDRPIDCEFAVCREGESEVLWLLQVRPLVLPLESELPESQLNRLEIIKQKIITGMKPNPFLMGKRNVYGVMPDWNPAEIIGIRPKPLALSLYGELITDSIWAYQRNNYGYRNLRSYPLMLSFYGLPYIDVRVSFNSFIPADLDEKVANRLVDYYIDKLVNRPLLHDKVEFEIVWSCYTLDLPTRLNELREKGFSREEQTAIADSLRRITNRILDFKKGLWRIDAAKIAILKARRSSLMESNLGPVENIYWLLEDAKRYGTLPFAGLARAGFMAVQILRSIVDIGIFTKDDYAKFMASISTVSKRMAKDRVKMERSDFLRHYGHLRPGTYEITSPRYDEDPELYFDWTNTSSLEEVSSEPFAMNDEQAKEIAKLLKSNSLKSDPIELFKFIKSAIELREEAKFEFSQNLSDALALMIEFASSKGIPREDIAYCDIEIFQKLYSQATKSEDLLLRSISDGKAQYAEALRVSLTPVITEPDDVMFFEWPIASPNYITQKKVIASVANIEDGDQLKGAIVCISNADPGFDWLFSHEIAGLITAWGGANSHMAIRAGEFGLPAIIGAGEVLYSRWSSAKVLELDCAAKRVEILV
ncbi:MAG: phosphoenolpyruvate synthase [Rhodospirillaceae bacterium]|nr:phosphoenolpyruvate synthase [Rhodospirillaceae bacterium]